MKIWAMPVARPYMLNARRAAEIMQADLAKIGVRRRSSPIEWARIPEALEGPVDRDGAVMLGWTGDNGDPDNFLDTLLGCDAVGGNNTREWCNKEFDDLVTKAKADDRPGRAHEALRAGAGDLQARGAVGYARPLVGLHADEQEGHAATRWIRSAIIASTASTSRSSGRLTRSAPKAGALQTALGAAMSATDA